MQLKKPLIPIILIILLSTIAVAETCQVSDVKNTLKASLYSFLTNPLGYNTLTVSDIKDLLIFYINITPGAITTDCSDKITSIMGRAGNQSMPTCEGEIEYGQCSPTTPKYCFAGNIVNRCDICGCGGFVCDNTTGTCDSNQPINCSVARDCGTDGYIGNNYCPENDIYKNYTTYTCINPNTEASDCTNETTPIITETCEFACSNGDCVSSSDYFIFQIDTNKITGTTFSFYADNADLSIDWGDGASDVATGTGLISHTYTPGGVYDVSLNGSASRISYYEGTAEALIDILTKVSDGVTGISSAEDMFRVTSNFGITPLSEPAFFDDISGDVTDMGYMFYSSQFNQPISNWDVSSVTRMYAMFRFSQFNQPISNWDVSSVTNIGLMFANSQFNQPISNWDVSSVTSIDDMFQYSPFNQDISNWDVSSVTSMGGMFRNASFNQDISNWDVSSVTDMDYMFQYSQFNQDISNWDVSSVTDMGIMFASSQFNQDISNWDVSSVTRMYAMFSNSQFNQDISNWDVSSVTSMYSMFDRSQFNQDISNWDVSSVTTMFSMFYNSQFNQDISGWNVSSVTMMYQMFQFSPFNQDISNWDVSSVTNMNRMFSSSPFNQDISNWDVSSVTMVDSWTTRMDRMFSNSPFFNQDLSGWCVTEITRKPSNFDAGANDWTLPNSRPIWGTCPS